ncbi:MAG: hypothetical protein ACOYUB_01235 [Patescibacteria group bacterium]
MDKIHNDKKIDAFANLYRASYCLATADRITGLSFVKKALLHLEEPEKNRIKSLLGSGLEDKILAEKICDIYLTIKTF